MNKKQIQKEQEKLKMERNQKPFDFHNKNDVMSVVYVTIGVIVFILLIFVGINIFNGNWELFTKKNKTYPAIDNTLVICGTMLNRDDSDYMVLAYDFEDDSQNVYAAMGNKYDTNNAIYFLNLGDGLNNSCITSDDIKFNVNDIKFKNPTLLQVKNKKVVKAYTSEKDILNILGK